MSKGNDVILTKLEQECYTSFDKTILTLSSGAVVLSITLITKLHHIHLSYLSLISWIFWVLSVSSQLVSHLISAKAMRDAKQGIYKLSGIPTFFNWVSFISFFIGIALFLIFMAANLSDLVR